MIMVRNARGLALKESTMKFSDLLGKLLKPLDWLEDSIAVLTMASVSVIIFGQVVSRYGFNFTPSWSEELSRFLIVWSIFIGVSIGVRKNQHIGVDALIRFLPHRLKVASEVLLNLIGVVVVCVLVYISIGYIKDTIEYEQLSPAMRIPMYIPYLAMPVGLTLSGIRFIQDIVRLFTRTDQAEEAIFQSEHADELAGNGAVHAAGLLHTDERIHETLIKREQPGQMFN
jgi:C4-dicarboxylate transporter DctQ subunit